jgi:prolyl oligopeptidase
MEVSMTPLRRLAFAAAALLAGAGLLDAQSVTRPGAVVDTLHGVPVADPWRGLEDLEADATRRWVREQDARARAFAAAAPERGRIRDRIAALAGGVRETVPRVAGGLRFSLRFPGSGGPGTSPEVVLVVRPEETRSRAPEDAGGSGERVLVDPAAEAPLEGASLTRALPSPDGSRVLYGYTRGGSTWETIRIRDVETGRDLRDVLTGIRGARSAVTWSADGTAVYYEHIAPPAEGASQREVLAAERLLRHRLGDDPAGDAVVYETPEHADRGIWHWLSDDGSILAFGAVDPATGHTTVLVADSRRTGAAAVPLVREPDAVYTPVGSAGRTLWLYTDRDAPRGRIVAVDLDRAERPAWRDLVPEGPDAISSWILATAAGGRLIVGYLRDALNVARVFDAGGAFLYEVELPYAGSLWSGFVGRSDRPHAYYSLSGLADPGSIWRLDVATGRSELVLRAAAGLDPASLTTRQVFYRSADGTRVPMFLVHRPGIRFPAPAWMYGYGFGAWPAAPWYQPHVTAFVEMGGVFALPNTRGGGEYGESWHTAGSGTRKQTAIDDYVAAAEWLVREGVTTSSLLTANGSSAGGAVAGAAVVQRPDLFGAAVIDYPVLDMLRYHLFTGAPGWRSEYGTAEDPDEFRALRAWSPVHTVREGACHPATLVAPGERDEITPPHHAYKFVAALQEAQGCAAPILLRVSWGAGHAAGADVASSVETWADQLAFLVRVLGEEGWVPAF